MGDQYLVAKISVRRSTLFVVPAQAGTQSLPWHEQGVVDRGMSEKRPCVYIFASKRVMAPFMSVSQVILRAVLGNIVRMLSVDLFAITECTG